MKRVALSTIIILLLPLSPPGRAGPKQASGADFKRAPNFALKDLRGRTVGLDRFKGKVVLLNFWATWCPPCRAEMPDLVKLQREYGELGLRVAGITYPPERASRVRRLAAELKINYPLLFGTRRVASIYGVEDILPVTVIIDREGRVRDRILGILTPEEFEQKVKPLLGARDQR
ncbi:MAG TPA: TlpA disulfide reductase family protein [Blastocatellia bacterium]|nr:TlpA disulfide reductase family protein [Blastocatellia bacterium]